MKRRTVTGGRRKARASTTDVLGPFATSDHSPPRRIARKWRTHYAHLLELRDQMLHKQANLTRDAIEEEPAFSLHMADAGTDSYDRDFALGMLSTQQDAVYEIEQALDRIRNGVYGICELTGKPIEMGRLEAIPWTRFTAATEKQLEQQGQAKRAGLGLRDTVAKSSETPRE